jgi:hypothetical protein
MRLGAASLMEYIVAFICLAFVFLPRKAREPTSKNKLPATFPFGSKSRAYGVKTSSGLNISR